MFLCDFLTIPQQTHRIHVGYIYLHVANFHGKCIGKYTIHGSSGKHFNLPFRNTPKHAVSSSGRTHLSTTERVSEFRKMEKTPGRAGRWNFSKPLGKWFPRLTCVYIYIYMFLQGVVQPLLGYWVVSNILYFHPENTKKITTFFFILTRKRVCFACQACISWIFVPLFFEEFKMFCLGVFFLLLLSPIQTSSLRFSISRDKFSLPETCVLVLCLNIGCSLKQQKDRALNKTK